jgi:hypothetical protein
MKTKESLQKERKLQILMDKKSCVRETQEKRRKSSRYIVVGNSQQKK